jgi:hypothetical protein
LITSLLEEEVAVVEPSVVVVVLEQFYMELQRQFQHLLEHMLSLLVLAVLGELLTYQSMLLMEVAVHLDH